LLRRSRSSVPQQTPDPHQAKAFYRFMASEFTTPTRLFSGHLQATLKRCEQQQAILVVQDTSEGDLSHLRATEGLGPIGNGRGRGFFFHTALAVSADEHHQLLGVLHQRTWVRPPGKSKRQRMTAAERKRQPNCESQKWAQTARASHDVVVASKEALVRAQAVRLIHVADREGDVYDFFSEIEQMGDSCVIRLVQNRRLEDEPKEGAEPELATKLMARVRQSAVVDTTTVSVRASKQHTEHEAVVELRACTLTLRPPQGNKGSPLKVNVVEVWEPNPPKGSQPLRWCLLTREPVETKEQVRFVVDSYGARWLIEEFHKGLKTGCGLEERQFKHVDSFLNFLALASVATCSLLALRATARKPHPLPASQVLTEVQLQVLRALRPKLPPEPTARDAMRQVAMMGGFLGRASDGEPGWQTMWRGWRELLAAEQGWRAAKGLPVDPTALDFSPFAGFG
jgi:Transposase Tn5 dimerisation domain